MPSFFLSFTFIAILMIITFAIGSVRQANHDPADATTNIRNSRQELRMIVYLLGGILIMLGVIADRLH